MKKSAVVYLLISCLFFLIAIFPKGDFVMDLFGAFPMILGIIFFAFGAYIIAIGDPLTKDKIKKTTYIRIISRVNSPSKDEDFIFVIRLADGSFSLLKEKQNLKVGRGYMFNNKNEWQETEEF